MKPELRMAINGISGPSTDEEATSHISPDSKSSSIPSQRISAIWFSRYGSTFDKIMRAKERKNLGLVLMIRAGSCTKVNTMLFPSKTDVWLTSIWASPLTAGLSSWRYLWKKSIFNVNMAKIETHFTLSWAMFDPIESGCKKKLVATSWAVVILEDRMVNCEMPWTTRKNQKIRQCN